jgi:hypothetical protein
VSDDAFIFGPSFPSRENQVVNRHLARLGVGLQLEAVRQQPLEHRPHLVERGGAVLGLRGDVEFVRIPPRWSTDHFKRLLVVGGHHQHAERDVLRRQPSQRRQHHRRGAHRAGWIRVAGLDRGNLERLWRGGRSCRGILREQCHRRDRKNEGHRSEHA